MRRSLLAPCAAIALALAAPVLAQPVPPAWQVVVPKEGDAELRFGGLDPQSRPVALTCARATGQVRIQAVAVEVLAPADLDSPEVRRR